MAATDLQVRQALADSLDGVGDWSAHPFTPEQINTPCAVIIEVDTQFDASMQRGSDLHVVLVRLLTTGDMETSQRTLSEGIYAFKDRLEEDSDLDGTVDDCRLRRKRGESEGQIEVAGGRFAVVDIEIEVYG